MAPSSQLREQAERCRSLARASIDPALRDNLLKLADEYSAQAGVQENNEKKSGGSNPCEGNSGA